ncbi:MAG: ribosome-associated translation inhibitor RaiA [Ruminococcus sp.]|uniref:ribosome hibernation-promoting factor, HPF/YfiA family n=1 Tax=Ruminococcus sp. TaxID=41978 RepID=UPI00386C6DE7|nr:ribosome-associated translation inhibitor RaiA [Ruminococcus sp.]MBQ1898140.1 ribosome-associated translation inhibitor RaiA [Ruminococcus sp.]MBQ4239366.1 ribosome-associated translation inhibitor RaiA [Ruminococcus sp.]
MKITYTERKVNLRDNFKQRVEKKLAKFDKIFSDEAQAFVVVTVDKSSQTVEITIRDRAMVYRAEKTMPEMNDAVDKCIDVLGRQLRKNKSKLEKRLRQGSLEELVAPEEEPVIEEEDYTIVRTKKIPVKPISVDEAILQMNMVGHKFYMFTNAETSEVNVVYLRDDGKYGLLVPTTDD